MGILFKRVSYFTDGYNIINQRPSHKEPTLLRANKVMDDLFKMIGQNFGDDFLTHITQRDRPEVRNNSRGATFRNLGNIGFTPRVRQLSSVKKVPYILKKMSSNNIPIIKIKFRVETIRAGTFTFRHGFKNMVDFLDTNWFYHHATVLSGNFKAITRYSIKDVIY